MQGCAAVVRLAGARRPKALLLTLYRTFYVVCTVLCRCTRESRVYLTGFTHYTFTGIYNTISRPAPGRARVARRATRVRVRPAPRPRAVVPWIVPSWIAPSLLGELELARAHSVQREFSPHIYLLYVTKRSK